MLRSELIVRYLVFVLAIDGAQLFITIPTSVYSSIYLHCVCDLGSTHVVPLWWHNGSSIVQRKGKYLISNETLYILDLRLQDNGLYTCGLGAAADRTLHICSGYNISVENTNPHYVAIHNRTVPENATSEKQGELYWHPKMKREDSYHVFSDEPVTLKVFFYCTAPTNPRVEWIPPINHFDTAPSIIEPTPFDCNSLEETQRVLNGTCYLASYTIHKLPASAEFACEVRSGASKLYITFTVYQSMLNEFLPASNPHADLEAFQSRWEVLPMDDEVLALLDPTLTHNFSEPSTVTSTQSPTESTSFPSRPYSPLLNYTSLQPTSAPGLRFFLLSPNACLRGNLTLHCQLPVSGFELEVWYLGQEFNFTPDQSVHCLSDRCFATDPVFLRKSKSKVFKLRSTSGSIREMYNRDETPLSITLTNLSTQHSGTYLCKYTDLYKVIHVQVKECSPRIDNFDLRLLILLSVPSGIILVILISLMVCIRSRRKPPVVEFVSKAHQFATKSNRKVDLVFHFHDLYPPSSDTGLLNVFHGSSNPFNSPNNPVHTSTVESQPYKHRKRTFGRPSRLAASFSQCATWEVDASRLQIGQLIAEGNFSSVYQATVNGPLPRCSQFEQDLSESSTPVAVKTVRAAHSMEERIRLFREIQIMVLLNAHPHVIRLLGICTKNGCPRILLEYAVHGNMRDFLRRNRPSTTASVDQLELPSINSSLDLTSTPELVKLDVQALLRFGCHVADALTYFESLKLVHRDIAARNVLITEGYVAKLCDFGLTFRLLDDDYVDDFREQLPFRWMAPESLEDDRFSLKSDIWSFGIYLWELFSLGQTPYPGLSSDAIGPWLATGNRNSKPSLANFDIYRVMLDCWHSEPSLRPSIRSLLDRLRLLASDDLRIMSRDSGFTSGNRSRQTSGPDSSVSQQMPRPRPVPPVRTVSLPGYTNLPTGYIEMSLEGYLEPRIDLRSADFTAV